MMNKVMAWVRLRSQEIRQRPKPLRERGRDRLAAWVGRNWARLSYATRVEPTWLELTHHHIPVADLATGFEGLRLVQMSDFHCSPRVTLPYLQEAVTLAQRQEPDVVVLTGDFIHKGFRHVANVAQILGKLNAPLGVYAVLGNHDYSVRNALGIRRYQHLHQAVRDALAREGIRVLSNESVLLERGGSQLALAGIEDLWSRECDPDRALADLPADMPRIVLAHNPCTIELLNGARCDLMLSGHTHGGQVNLPGIGPVALGPKGRQFAAGFYQRGASLVYVNKGVGFGLQVRFRVRPEVALFTLLPRP